MQLDPGGFIPIAIGGMIIILVPPRRIGSSGDREVVGKV